MLRLEYLFTLCAALWKSASYHISSDINIVTVQLCSEIVKLRNLTSKLWMEWSFPCQYISLLLQVSHSCYYLKTGFSAFPQSSNFMTKQILPHATQNLQVINTGVYSCTYIYICILKIQKLWAILIDIWKTNTEKFLSLTQNLCLHCITNLALKTLSIMNAFSWLKTS